MKLYRHCTKCGVEKPHSCFHKHKQCKNGINSVCKECRKPLSSANYAKQSVEYKIWHRAKNRAKVKNLLFDIEIEDIVIPEVCPVLNIPMDVPSLDRHIPEKGYTKENIFVISNRANTLKNNGTLEEFKKLIVYLESKKL